jgi:hypothetical protein
MKSNKNFIMVLILITTSLFFSSCTKATEQGNTSVIKETTEEKENTKETTETEEAIENEEAFEDNGVQIPVLMGGAMFTGMEPMVTENYEDGGYYYSEMTEDGMTIIINSSQMNTMGTDETIEDYIIKCAYALGNEVVLEPDITLDEVYSEKLTYPVYLVSWLTGENEDTKRWEMFFFMTDSHTYTYTFNSTVDNAEDMLDIWMETFDNLYLG